MAPGNWFCQHWRVRNPLSCFWTLRTPLCAEYDGVIIYKLYWNKDELLDFSTQGCILLPCLFNLCGGYIMWNPGLDESQAGIKIAGRNTNNLRYADDITVGRKWRGTKEPLDEGENESEKAGLKFNIQETKIMESSPIISWQIEGGKWKQWQTLFSWAPKSLQWLQPWN